MPDRLTILVVYSRPAQPGGMDVSSEAELKLLRDHGHDVHELVRNNEDPEAYSLAQKTRLRLEVAMNRSGLREVRQILGDLRVDILHARNLFRMFSPSIHTAALRAGAATIQDLRFHRHFCLPGNLRRDGRNCEDCLGKVAWRGVFHACVQDSRLRSASAWHVQMQSWRAVPDVSAFIALSEDSRDLAIRGGLPPGRVFVRGNHLPDPLPAGPHAELRSGAVFVGRLVEHKGVRTLLRAWERLPLDVPLTIVGDGPARGSLENAARGRPIRFTGRVPHAQALEYMRQAVCLVMPAEWHEPFGRTTMEALACGTPVIASGHGTMAELVEDGRTGWLFEPGESDRLARAVAQAFGAPEECARRGREARKEYENRFTPEVSYGRLMDIYRRVLAHTERR